MKIKYITSPALDHMLTPDEYRRYTSHMMAYFAIVFLAVSYLLSHVLFNQGYEFWATVANIRSNNEKELAKIMLPLFYTKCAIAFIPASVLGWIVMNKFTKPVNRQIHKLGNFLDDSKEVFINMEKDFALKTAEKKMALIREGEFDYNKSWKGKYKMNKTIYFPREILELSTVVRGEAGSGKSVVLDRFIKESIDNKNKVVLHSIKGDEIDKLTGYTNMYIIEPWNEERGFALDFLNMVVSPSKQIQNANIRTFVDSFSVATPGKEDFFEKGSTAVMEALVRSVVDSNKDESGKVRADLGAIVDTWNNFQVKEVNTTIDLTDPLQVKKELSENDDQLQKIKDFLLEWNPPATIYVDPQNAKTSLCVLASCIDLIRKFETLSSFWKKNIEQEKILNIQKWLNTEPMKSRQVIILVNSNQFADVANCYISAFVNLVVNEVIEERYKAEWELHFMLDEFPQLTSIDINKFLKLPDVGRGKKIRTTIALQRTSQIKANFNTDGESFVAGFQNKIWCRMATDDLSVIDKELGKRDVSEIATTANYTAQGKSISSKITDKKVDVINIHDMQNSLGPVFLKKIGPDGRPIFCGVRVLFNFANMQRIASVIMPPVVFEKKEKLKIRKSSASTNTRNDRKKDSSDEESKEEILIQSTLVEEIETKNFHLNENEVEVNDPADGILNEKIGHALGGEALVTVLHVAELMESLESHTLNNNTTEIVQEVVEEKVDISKKLEALKNRSKKKQELEL